MDAAEGSGVNGGRNGNSADLVYELKKIKSENEEVEGGDEMELSLGLSTNGRFGVDPTREKLRRSTSLSNVVVADNSAGEGSNREARAAAPPHAPLMRASSLPSKVETQERRRRQMENLKNPMVVNGNGNRSGGNGLHVVQQDERHAKLHSLEARGPAVEANEEHNRNTVNDMPYVSTRGFGPDNRQINGFLYRYRRGEDVKILCVCHGLFLSPAEFVKHGGGGDVKNPLKHIVVTSFPLYN